MTMNAAGISRRPWEGGSVQLTSRLRGASIDAGEDASGLDADLRAVTLARSDPRAFAPIYERYAEAIYSFCYRRLGDPELASDAASTVFLRAVAAVGSFQPRRAEAGSTVRAWLYQIARNIVTDHHRRARSHASIDLPDAPDLIDRTATPEELALGAEEARLVAGLLSALPERQRTVVELRLAGLTGAEIAHTLGTTVPAVKALQVRAYRELRQRLDATPTLLTRERPS
jgi:RNA polymerase sigma-70 factor, ECF subfamily